MDRIKQLEADRDERRSQVKEILTLASKDKRNLTEEEQGTIDTFASELDRIEATLKVERQAIEWDRTGAQAVDRPVEDSQVEDKNPWGNMSTPDGRVQAFGSFLGAVAQHYQRGRTDPRLVIQDAGPKAAASGLNTSVPSEGGVLVRRDFTMMLLDKAREEAVWAPRCTRVSIGEGFDGIEAPYIDETSRANGQRWGGVQVFRRAEADTVAASKPKLGKFELQLEDLMAVVYTTGRATRDAAALGQIIADAFASEFAFKLDDEIVRGTGAGQCLGLLPGGNLGSATIQQAKEGGPQTADTVVAANVQKMFARMPARNAARGAWYINLEVWPHLFAMNQANMPVFMPGVSLSNAPFGMLLGRPLVPTEQSSAIGDLGDIVFADMSEYLLIEKGGLSVAESMHVRFLYDEMAFRFMAPVNGAPKWKTALTKYKGADAISPFVALEAR